MCSRVKTEHDLTVTGFTVRVGPGPYPEWGLAAHCAKVRMPYIFVYLVICITFSFTLNDSI